MKQAKLKRQNADGGLDAGLECLAAFAKPGQSFSHRQIAYVCGCSRGWIFLLEKQALQRIREALRKKLQLNYGQMYGPGDKR